MAQEYPLPINLPVLALEVRLHSPFQQGRLDSFIEASLTS